MIDMAIQFFEAKWNNLSFFNLIYELWVALDGDSDDDDDQLGWSV